jgi:uncharacterized protein (DUF1800 family)
MSLRKTQHLLWRAGFGPTASDDLTASATQSYARIKRDSAAAPQYINVLDDQLLAYYKMPSSIKNLEETARRAILAKHQIAIQDLNLKWLKEMTESKAQLREKIALFWHGHFCTYTLNIHHAQELLHVLRTHALGNFRTLLTEVSHSAAMMIYLNAQQNRKGHPNENFARELMELFTLGRGNYTENDIKEAARSFTGWWIENDGTYAYRAASHDEGEKTVFGKTGKWLGEDVLGFLLEKKETALHITRKLYRFVVNDTPDEKRVAALADVFYKSNYEIGALLDAIYNSDWFYTAAQFGGRIKSPVELLVGLRRTLGLTVDNPEYYLTMQRVLGQILFFPPNVAGWPGGRTWIDSTTLMIRMRLPQMLNEHDAINLQAKPNNDMTPGTSKVVGAVFSNAKARALDQKTKIDAQLDWAPLMQKFANVKRENLAAVIAEALLVTELQVPESIVTNYSDATSRDSFIKTTMLRVMSLPEYQLC